jgi:lysophospholipase L1-like esterase
MKPCHAARQRRAGRRGTLGCRPVTAVESQARRKPARRPRRDRVEDGRRLRPAGHALIVALLALALGALLNAPGIHKSAHNQPDGWKRDAALAVTGPLADVSHALLLDRPRAALKSALGRGGDDEIDDTIALPPPPGPASAPLPRKRLAFTPKRKLRLWVAGDSLIIVPGFSIVRAAAGSPVIESVGDVDGRIATGLERPDVFNWFEHIRAQLKKLKPRAVVVGFGANDDHDYMTGLPEGTPTATFGSPQWTFEYRRRVAGVMDTVTRAGAFLVWIGLPITRDPEQSRRFDTINAVVQQEAAKREGRVTYLDTYTTFAGDDGGFTEYQAQPSGRLVKVRASDGVHFEPEGGAIIAREVLRRLNEAYDLTTWRHKRRAA